MGEVRETLFRGGGHNFVTRLQVSKAPPDRLSDKSSVKVSKLEWSEVVAWSFSVRFLQRT
jgi:hypothetical protein